MRRDEVILLAAGSGGCATAQRSRSAGFCFENRPMAPDVRALLRARGRGACPLLGARRVLNGAGTSSIEKENWVWAGRVATVRIPHLSLVPRRARALQPPFRPFTAAGTVVLRGLRRGAALSRAATPSPRAPNSDPGTVTTSHERPRPRATLCFVHSLNWRVWAPAASGLSSLLHARSATRSNGALSGAAGPPRTCAWRVGAARPSLRSIAWARAVGGQTGRGA